jgi:hypothetical protein
MKRLKTTLYVTIILLGGFLLAIFGNIILHVLTAGMVALYGTQVYVIFAIWLTLAALVNLYLDYKNERKL